MSTVLNDFDPPPFRQALAIQFNVIGALAMRDLQSRFGRQNIGYLWVIGEPMMFASVISVLHALGNFGLHVKGIHPYEFTLVGYNIFIIFRNVFNRAAHMLDHNSHLLYHNMIKPTDIVVSQAVAEMLGTVAAFFILLGIGIMADAAVVPPRPLYLFLAIFLMFWLSLASSMLIAAYTYQSHFLSRFVHPASYFMIPLSGAFFTMSILPNWARDYMQWNPLMNVFEIARYGAFEVASDKYLYPGYVMVVCASLTYWGLLALRRVRSKIHVA